MQMARKTLLALTLALAALIAPAGIATAGPSQSAPTAVKVCQNPTEWGFGERMGHGQCSNSVNVKVKVRCINGRESIDRESRAWRYRYNNYECPSGWWVDDIWILVQQ